MSAHSFPHSPTNNLTLPPLLPPLVVHFPSLHQSQITPLSFFLSLRSLVTPRYCLLHSSHHSLSFFLHFSLTSSEPILLYQFHPFSSNVTDFLTLQLPPHYLPHLLNPFLTHSSFLLFHFILNVSLPYSNILYTLYPYYFAYSQLQSYSSCSTYNLYPILTHLIKLT